MPYTRLLSLICFNKNFGRQMRLITGPRQCGKTSIAKTFLEEKKNSNLYFNWDKRETRSAYRANPSFFMKDVYETKKGKSKVWVCFDEIHKIPKWKNVLKGIFDSYEDSCQFIITGSARLDLLKYTGESLLGRYFSFRLFPLRLIEILKNNPKKIKKPASALSRIEEALSFKVPHQNIIKDLITLGGFPEPFLSGSETFVNKWRHDNFNHYLREDLRDITAIPDIEKCFHLMELLPPRIGSPLSLNSLREDLEVSHTAVRNWLRALTLVYALFSISPYSKKINRSVTKEQKYYFFDWSLAKEKSSIFENYVAVELLAYCAYLTDAGLGDYELFYVRTKEGKESDFLITQDKKPWILFEVKLSASNIDNQHKNHASLLGDIPLVVLTEQSNQLKVESKKHFIISADRFFANWM